MKEGYRKEATLGIGEVLIIVSRFALHAEAPPVSRGPTDVSKQAGKGVANEGLTKRVSDKSPEFSTKLTMELVPLE